MPLRRFGAAAGAALLAATVLAATVLAATVLLAAAPARAATPTFTKLVAFVRAGDVFVSKGATERRLTSGGGHARPRWSPDGSRIAYLRDGYLWVMNADGSGKRRVTSYPAHGPSWTRDGRAIAFVSGWCAYLVSSTTPNAVPSAVADPGGGCATAPPAGPWIPSGSLVDRLRGDRSVAVSTGGTFLAAPLAADDCAAFDSALTYFVLSNGAEVECLAFFGGGDELPGFAVVPAWRPDDRRLAWTAYREGAVWGEGDVTPEDPVHVEEYDLTTRVKRRIGRPLDRELEYVSTTRALVTGQHNNGSWLILIDLVSGARTPFRQGSQADYQG